MSKAQSNLATICNTDFMCQTASLRLRLASAWEVAKREVPKRKSKITTNCQNSNYTVKMTKFAKPGHRKTTAMAVRWEIVSAWNSSLKGFSSLNPNSLWSSYDLEMTFEMWPLIRRLTNCCHQSIAIRLSTTDITSMLQYAFLAKQRPFHIKECGHPLNLNTLLVFLLLIFQYLTISEVPA